MKFEKVSKQQYMKDMNNDIIYDSNHKYPISGLMEGYFSHEDFSHLRETNSSDIYEKIKLPERATMKSAGYDIFAPYGFTLQPGETIKLATGLRVLLDDDKFLMCAPRSGQGFKTRLQLDNTVGIIDADYSDSSNEGHIMMKLTNDSHTGSVLRVKTGEGIAQAIILKFFTVEDDNVTAKRDGGFGSTTNKEENK